VWVLKTHCICKFGDLATVQRRRFDKILAMIAWLRHLLGWLLGAFRSRQDLVLENLALRQQLLTLHAQRPRHRFTTPQKLFWVLLRKAWAGWRWPLMLVTPRTVVGWHRAAFRLYWKWLSRARPRGGRKPVSKEIRALIFQIAAENPTWGAPRIHGELLMLGFEISEPTVSRWLWSYQILGTANPYPRHIWGIRWRQSFYWFRGRSRRLPQVSYGPGKSVTDR